MKWSWKIARVAGIDVYMHTTFLLLIGWIAISTWLNRQNVMDTLSSIVFVLALFTCVVLHEYGHALTARRFGIQTKDITLLPIGGVASLERMPEKPMQELLVAIAGPAVNLVIALVLAAGLLLTNTLPSFQSLSITSGNFFARLLLVNLSLALFNLLPAFPMDGGRIVRALLATRLEYARATQIAATLGQGIALLLGFFGLFDNPLLLFVAFFVWIGAAQESSMVQVKSALSGIPVSRAMLTDFHTVSPTDSLGRVVQLLLSGSQQDFPVVVDNKVVGIITRDQVIHGLAEHNDSIFVSYLMSKEFQTVDTTQMLDELYLQSQERLQRLLPVVHNGELVGMLTMENLGEFLMIQSAIRQRKTSMNMSPG